jgi:hypothetical protein
MNISKLTFHLLVFSLVFSCGIFLFSQKQDESLRWYKGNTHTHTLNSDGDSSPVDAVRWYREHGYNFLVLTDHNFLTNVEGLNSMFAAENKFLVIKGVEVSTRFGPKPIHLNALNPEKDVAPRDGENVVDTIQNNVDEIRMASGVPQINHPNYKWAITANDLKQIENCALFELYSGHPVINNFGGGGFPGLEEIWDQVLSSGKLIYGVAVDDVHVFKEPWNRNEARPGQAWIMVRSERLTPDSIVSAIERGHFYASTGVELDDYHGDEKELVITIKKKGDEKFCTQFIGKNGRVYKEDMSNPATYRFKGDEMYIRAKIRDSNGRMAWTQPKMLRQE